MVRGRKREGGKKMEKRHGPNKQGEQNGGKEGSKRERRERKREGRNRDTGEGVKGNGRDMIKSEGE